MTRRTATLLATAIAIVVLLVVGLYLPVPYVAESPGPVSDTLGQVNNRQLVQINGHPTYPTTGRLDLVTVEVNEDLTLFDAVKGWFASDEAVVPEDLVNPSHASQSEQQQQGLEQMAQSQERAVAAALCYLHISSQVSVDSVAPGYPASKVLQPNDVLLAVDGAPIHQVCDLTNDLSKLHPGQPVTIRYQRGSAPPQDAHLVMAADPDQPGHAVIGISPKQTPPFEVKFGLQDVGGPSAGMMFALAIIDRLTPDQLTGGRIIAGTGTISPDGTVGPIGGIEQKLVAARRSGATVFLVPSGNCADASRAVPAGLQLVKVDTLSGAVTALESLQRGQHDQPGC